LGRDQVRVSANAMKNGGEVTDDVASICNVFSTT
jgi:hypothetical protein